MGDRVEVFAVTVPAGTLKTAPVKGNLAFPAGYLRRVEVVIPDGVGGAAGFLIAYDDQPLIPNTPGAWITGNGEKWADEPAGEMVGSRWALWAYNAGTFQHTFYVRCYVTEIGEATGAGTTLPIVTPIPIAATSTAEVGTVDLTPAPTLALTGFDAPPPDLVGLTDTTDTAAGVDTLPADVLTIDAPPVIDIPPDTTTGDAP